jgi:hypothetical protein
MCANTPGLPNLSTLNSDAENGSHFRAAKRFEPDLSWLHRQRSGQTYPIVTIAAGQIAVIAFHDVRRHFSMGESASPANEWQCVTQNQRRSEASSQRPSQSKATTAPEFARIEFAPRKPMTSLSNAPLQSDCDVHTPRLNIHLLVDDARDDRDRFGIRCAGVFSIHRDFFRQSER